MGIVHQRKMDEFSSVVAALMREVQPVVERDLTPNDRDQACILRPHLLHKLFSRGGFFGYFRNTEQ